MNFRGQIFFCPKFTSKSGELRVTRRRAPNLPVFNRARYRPGDTVRLQSMLGCTVNRDVNNMTYYHSRDTIRSSAESSVSLGGVDLRGDDRRRVYTRSPRVPSSSYACLRNSAGVLAAAVTGLRRSRSRILSSRSVASGPSRSRRTRRSFGPPPGVLPVGLSVRPTPSLRGRFHSPHRARPNHWIP